MKGLGGLFGGLGADRWRRVEIGGRAISRGQRGGRTGGRPSGGGVCRVGRRSAVPHPCQGPAQSARCRCWCSFARSVLLCRAVCLCHASCLLLSESRLRSLLGELPPPPPHPPLCFWVFFKVLKYSTEEFKSKDRTADLKIKTSPDFKLQFIFSIFS